MFSVGWSGWLGGSFFESIVGSSFQVSFLSSWFLVLVWLVELVGIEVSL